MKNADLYFRKLTLREFIGKARWRGPRPVRSKWEPSGEEMRVAWGLGGQNGVHRRQISGSSRT